MKLRISYSGFSTLLTVIMFVVLYVGCIATIKENPAFYWLLALYTGLIVAGLFFAPAYIMADNGNIVLGSLLKKKRIPMSEVEDVELFQPTMWAIRLCASGGFMGYWGIFREGDIGSYYGFYGKASNCFLVRLKNGKKYVLGCDQPDKMVEYIKNRLASDKNCSRFD